MTHPASEPECRRVSPARLATWALREELLTWPKPGLVSPNDPGAHADMDATLFEASIAALADYFSDIYAAGRHRVTMAKLRVLGIAAEARMLRATGGVNTHRGAIFSLGLLIAAAGRRDADVSLAGQRLGSIVRRAWGPAIARVKPGCGGSHGLTAACRYRVVGARGEAASGFPCVYNVGLPALRAAQPAGWNCAKVQCLFAILAHLDDTNLLHRGGAAGLDFARAQARAFLKVGGVGRPEGLCHAAHVHRQFVARRLSPGGAGDLLAATILLDGLDRTAAPEC